MKITVRYFASIREAIGQGSEAVETSVTTLGALRDELIARGGAHASSLARGRAVRMALAASVAALDGGVVLEDHKHVGVTAGGDQSGPPG